MTQGYFGIEQSHLDVKYSLCTGYIYRHIWHVNSLWLTSEVVVCCRLRSA